MRSPTVLLIGYGNPGRLDDGLGPALAEAIERDGIEGLTVEADYQLTVEDAAAVAEHDVVIFADAAVADSEPFFFRRIAPSATGSFSTHSVEPAAVLALAAELFGARTTGYVLGVRGYEFDEFGERLSPRAQANLAAAAAFLRSALPDGRFDEVGDAPPAGDATRSTASFEDGPCKTEST